MTKVVSVVCPHCKQKLNVKGADDAVAGTVVCPKCQNRLQVTFTAPNGGGGAPAGGPLPADRTIYEKGTGAQMGQQSATAGYPKSDQGQEGRTILPDNGAIQNPGYITFNGQPLRTPDGRPNPLMIGQNIIGRAAPSSPANMQVPTTDIYCSRQQAIITVLRMNNGGLRTFIRNYMNKNKTWVNGAQLLDGEEVVLKNGDHIKMGDTTVVYVER